MKLDNLFTCQSLYFGRRFTILPNLVFDRAFRLEVTSVSFGFIACCGDCLGTYSRSTIDDSAIAHCTVTRLSVLSPPIACDETVVSNGGGCPHFLRKHLA